MTKISKLNVELLERKATCAHAADNEKWSEKRKVHIGKKESTRKESVQKLQPSVARNVYCISLPVMQFSNIDNTLTKFNLFWNIEI